MGSEGYGKIPLTLLGRKDDSGIGKGKEGDVETCGEWWTLVGPCQPAAQGWSLRGCELRILTRNQHT